VLPVCLDHSTVLEPGPPLLARRAQVTGHRSLASPICRGHSRPPRFARPHRLLACSHLQHEGEV
jgi:hypothetical protein